MGDRNGEDFRIARLREVASLGQDHLLDKGSDKGPHRVPRTRKALYLDLVIPEYSDAGRIETTEDGVDFHARTRSDVQVEEASILLSQRTIKMEGCVSTKSENEMSAPIVGGSQGYLVFMLKS